MGCEQRVELGFQIPAGFGIQYEELSFPPANSHLWHKTGVGKGCGAGAGGVG